MKVLVIRFSSIGDIVLTTPVLRWLHEQKQAEVHYLTKSSFINLVKHNPAVSKVHSLGNKIEDTIKVLKKEHFDIVIDLHKNLRSKKVSKSLDAKYITFNKLNVRKWLFVNFKINLLPKKHIVDRYAEALAPLKLDTNDRAIDYFFPANHSFDLAQYGLAANDYICIVIGGSYTTKQIPSSTILDIIKRLNLNSVLLGGGDSDAKKAAEIMQNGNTQTINLVNKISLTDSAYVMQQSSSVITSDTGLMHIASAFEVPIHAVWGNTHPDFGMYAYRPNGKKITDYQVSLPCNPCSKLGSDKCPREHFDCMLKQNVEQIVKNCPSTDHTQ